MGLFGFGKPDITPQDDELKSAQATIQELRDKITALEQKCQILDGQNNAYAYTDRTQREHIEELEVQLGLSKSDTQDKTDVEIIDKVEDKPESKPEDKPESKPEDKPEAKSEATELIASLEQKIKDLEWESIEKDAQINELEGTVAKQEAELTKCREFIPKMQALIKAYQNKNSNKS